MEAGHELNGLVAEKIFGWTKQGDGPYYKSPTAGDYLFLSGKYSASFDGMEQVIGRLRDLGFYIEIYTFRNGQSGYGVNVWARYPKPTDENQALAVSESMPLAICVAALRAAERWPNRFGTKTGCSNGHDWFDCQVPAGDSCQPIFHQVCRKCRWDAGTSFFMSGATWSEWAVPQLRKLELA
jgi:hypothetical protein